MSTLFKEQAAKKGFEGKRFNMEYLYSLGYAFIISVLATIYITSLLIDEGV